MELGKLPTEPFFLIGVMSSVINLNPLFERIAHDVLFPFPDSPTTRKHELFLDTELA